MMFVNATFVSSTPPEQNIKFPPTVSKIVHIVVQPKCRQGKCSECIDRANVANVLTTFKMQGTGIFGLEKR